MASDEFHIREVLYQGRDVHVSRGKRVRDGFSVVIKRWTGSPNDARRVELVYEFGILQQLAQAHTQGVPTPLDLVQRSEELALIMDDTGGYALRVFQNRQALAMPEILHVAISVARILGDVHRCGVTHKDVNPNNIVFNRESGSVALIDFQIASVLRREMQSPDMVQRHAGTLAYMAPEQTGRMNRALDYRADFYSLGATLYELVSGHLPFEYSDIDQLLHAVLTQPPPDLVTIAPHCPPVLARLIDKLMAKAPERRYQSATGVCTDLQQCLDELLHSHIIPEFELATQDRGERFDIPQKVYGRSVEIAAVEACYQRAADGRREMLWIAGPSGIGKTALVGELQRHLVQQRALFGSGKCDQLRHHMPFNGLALAMNELVRQILMEPDSVVANWRRRLSETIGGLGRCLVDAAPTLELLLGTQPALLPLGPQESENRLLLAWQRLISGLSAEQPLVLFLDDLQWADTGTFKLIETLARQRGEFGAGLLVIGAYRDNEVASGHPLLALFDAVCGTSATTGQLSVGALPRDTIAEMVRDATRAAMPACQELAQWVLAKTAGNPFFVREFLAALHARGLFTYDNDSKSWTWDWSAVQAAHVTTNVAQLMGERLRELKQVDQNVLSFAACLGNQFTLDDLSTIMHVDRTSAAKMLEAALREGLVVPLQSHYRYASESVLDVAYKFAHDQIQHAAYRLQPPEQIVRTHYQIGRRLVAKHQGQPPETWVLAALGHLNAAISLITDPAERQDLAQLNHQGALEARSAVAYGTALEYLQTAVDLRGGDAAWQSHRDIMWQLSLDIADCYFLLGELDKANATVAQIAAHATSNIEKAEVFRRGAVSLAATSHYRESLDAGFEALKLLGVTLPRQGTRPSVASTMLRVRWATRGKNIADLPMAAPMTAPATVLAMRVLNDLSHPAYFTDPLTFMLLGLTMAHLTVEHGVGVYSASAFAIMGVSFSLLNNITLARRYMEASKTCIDRIPDSYNPSSIQFLSDAFVDFSRIPPQQGFERYHALTMATLERGDPLNAWLLAAAECLCLLVVSPKRCIERCNLYEATLPFGDVASMLPLLVAVRQGARALVGETHSLDSLNDGTYEETAADATFQTHDTQPTAGAFYDLRMQLAFLHRDFAKAVRWARKADAHELFNKEINHQQIFFCMYALLSITGLAAEEKRSSVPRGEDAPLWKRARRKLRGIAEDGVALFGGAALLVDAEVAALRGHVGEATRLYEEATSALARSHYPSLAATAHECAGRYLLRHDFKTAGVAHLQAALLAFNTWGARAKSDQLEREFAHHLRAAIPSVHPTAAKYRFAGTTTDLLTRSDVDFPAMLKATQSLSSEMVRERLLARLVETVVAQTSATRVTYAVRDGASYVAECDSMVTSRPLPQGLLHWVGRSQEPLSTNAPAQHPDFGREPYFSSFTIRSLLCVPVLHQGEVIGLIYAETDLVDRSFSIDSVVLVRVLAAQLAVALENARIHGQLERQFAEQKGQLQTALDRLAMHEREAHETQIAGGFAHEMRNALSGARMTLAALYPPDTAPSDGSTCFETTRANLQSLAAMRSDDPATRQIVELLQADQALYEECFEHLNSVLGRAVSLTQQMLDYSQIGTIMVGADATPADNLVSRVLRDLQAQLSDRGATAQVTVEPDLVIPMKEEHAYVILRNLVANAGDALRDCPGERRIMVRAEKSHRGVVLSVEDNGMGMSEKTQADLFRPFFTTKGSRGTGLGLGLSRRLAMMYGGDLQFRSVQRKGTTFELVLPV